MRGRKALLGVCVALFALVLTACGGEGDRSTTDSSTNAPATSPAERTAPVETQAATKPPSAKQDGRKPHKAKPTPRRETGTGGQPAGKEEAQGGKEKQKPTPVEEEPEGERAPQQGAADLNSNEASGDSAPPRTSDSNQSKDREPSSVEGTEPKDANAP